MGLIHLLVFVAASSLIAALPTRKLQVWALFIASILATYWLQPAVALRHFDFWLPTASLILTAPLR